MSANLTRDIVKINFARAWMRSLANANATVTKDWAKHWNLDTHCNLTKHLRQADGLMRAKRRTHGRMRAKRCKTKKLQ